MAIAEHEVTQELRLRLTREQQERLKQAASATGQSVDEFAISTLLHAAGSASEAPPTRHPLDKIIGIFKDEPLMDELMERIHADRRAEIAQAEIEAQTEGCLFCRNCV